MKKTIHLLLAAALCLGCMACEKDATLDEVLSASPPESDSAEAENGVQESSEDADNDAATTEAPKTLIVYYSYTNHTETIVSDLQTQVDADVVEIEPAEKGLNYAANGYAIGSALISAIRNNPDDAASYPAIDPVGIELEAYETVIVATPLWWSNMAAPMQTFLFQYGSQMAGKHIGLIVSSSSSGISGVEADAKRLIPDGDFLTPSLWIRSSQTSSCHALIADWLEDIDYSDLVSSIRQVQINE
ncbi:MAG: flavodoxin [Bacteroidales bacterium]|nr:flavodoxin [Bacteroidales bacterium]